MSVDALRAAARAAIVISSVFAFATNVIDRPQTSLFAAFGSFAVLALVDFGGRRAARLIAYLVFDLAGAGLIAIGTLCGHNAWLASAAMAVVAFLILYSGAFSGYLAAAANGAILLFVLPANVPAPNSAIPDRLLGWALAASAGTAAALLLWPSRRRADLRRAAGSAIRTVIELIEATREELPDRHRAARTAVDGLVRSFLGSQHRPAGPTRATAALVAVPAELDWLLSLLPASPDDSLDGMFAEEAAVTAATVDVLRASADRLEGGSSEADFDRLEAARSDLAHAVIRGLPSLLPAADGTGLPKALETPFRIRSSSFAAQQLATYVMRATAGAAPGEESLEASSGRLAAVRRLAREHATPESVWLQNSFRAAVALALAVFIAQRSGLQHAFWVVLGTLSVLRSNALATGSSVLSALAGTAAGIVVGAAVVIAIGTHEAVLWAVLPIAIFLATYAPRAISFAAGQAAFTIVLFVLFNLIQPVGWAVGVVRIEDVAIGFAISLSVGALFWPRGAGAVLRSDLAEAYARGADAFTVAMRRLIGAAEIDELARAATAADVATHRVDDSFRQYLVERTATRYPVEDVAALVGGALRIRRAAQALLALRAMVEDGTDLRPCGGRIENELNAFQTWYLSLAYAIVNSRSIGPPHLPDDDGRRALFECAQRTLAKGGSKAGVLALLWAVEHLENLRKLESRIATRLQVAQRPL